MQPSDAMRILKAFVAEHSSMSAAARALGVSPSFLSEVLREDTPISDKVLKGLGLAREVIIVHGKEL